MAATLSSVPPPDAKGASGGKPLVVCLHAYRMSARNLRLVESVIRAVLPTAKFLTPSLPLKLFSVANPADTVKVVLHKIDQDWATGSYDRVVLVGHSFGALLARKVYIAACGNQVEAPLEKELAVGCAQPRSWASSVDRIVQLAGMNNGWSIDYHMSLARAWMMSTGMVAAWLIHLFGRKWPVIFAARRGSPFLAQLRIQWLIMRRAAPKAGIGHAPVVQLLGTVDDLVSPHDNIDLVTGYDFYFLDVPKSGHENVIEMDDSPEGLERKKVLTSALKLTPEQLGELSVQVGDITPLPPDPKVEEVVFVIHGIRDEGFWTEKIARAIVREARSQGRVFARETSTYGYFGMLPFLMSWERRRKVEWLMDRYAEVIARYPNATRIHYVGHSNGTYLLARALKDYPCCRFDRVVFAGSVVPTTYSWSTYMHGRYPRVGQVLNYAATADWVVAYFPGLFEFLHIPDLGDAGFRGFRQNSSSGYPGIENVEYVVGSHGAALQEGNWKAIARFIVCGPLPKVDPCGVPVSKKHARLIALLGRFPPLVWLLLLLILLVPPVLLVYGLHEHNLREWLATAAIIGYGALILYVANRL